MKKKPKKKSKKYSVVKTKDGKEHLLVFKILPDADITSEDLRMKGISHVVNQDGSLDLVDEKLTEAKVKDLLKDL